MEDISHLMTVIPVLSGITVNQITLTTGLAGIFTLLLLLFSAMVSGSEVAFFSLSPQDIKSFKESKTNKSKVIVQLIENPKELLATILVSNNFINIAIVILASYVVQSLVSFGNSELLSFLIQVVLITFLLLLFGEIIPKIYANQMSNKVVNAMAYPLFFMSKVFKPVSYVLITSTGFIDKKFHSKQNISIDDLSNALELTSESLADEKNILKGIIEFGNTEVSEIMCPRVDVLSLDISANFSTVLKEITEAGYSRIPVYSGSFDNIKGILYIKDLLPHIHKEGNFHWQSLLRPPYFVPEKKKINELLEELQTDKIHMAIVVDEYGGTSGIITMEDIIEEIVGDISDEFDEDDINFTKINENSFLFDGKTLLNDFYKIVEVDNSVFEEIKGDADTLAGLILEIKGEFPNKHDIIKYKNFTFVIEDMDKRRIVKIKATIDR